MIFFQFASVTRPYDLLQSTYEIFPTIIKTLADMDLEQINGNLDVRFIAISFENLLHRTFVSTINYYENIPLCTQQSSARFRQLLSDELDPVPGQSALNHYRSLIRLLIYTHYLKDNMEKLEQYQLLMRQDGFKEKHDSSKVQKIIESTDSALQFIKTSLMVIRVESMREYALSPSIDALLNKNLRLAMKSYVSRARCFTWYAQRNPEPERRDFYRKLALVECKKVSNLMEKFPEYFPDEFVGDFHTMRALRELLSSEHINPEINPFAVNNFSDLHQSTSSSSTSGALMLLQASELEDAQNNIQSEKRDIDEIGAPTAKRQKIGDGNKHESQVRHATNTLTFFNDTSTNGATSSKETLEPKLLNSISQAVAEYKQRGCDQVQSIWNGKAEMIPVDGKEQIKHRLLILNTTEPESRELIKFIKSKLGIKYTGRSYKSMFVFDGTCWRNMLHKKELTDFEGKLPTTNIPKNSVMIFPGTSHKVVEKLTAVLTKQESNSLKNSSSASNSYTR